MNTQLILNADDYGLTDGVSRGIRFTHLNGLVTSTSCMMNLPGVVPQIQQAIQECPELGLGVHLTLTAGSPLLPPQIVLSLCDSSGKFQKRDMFIANLSNLYLSEIKAEWLAQIQKFIQTTGKKPTHLDSHHHCSYFSPAVFRIMLELAREFDCAIRLPALDKQILRNIDIPDDLLPVMDEALPGLLREFDSCMPGGFFADFFGAGASREALHSIVTSSHAGTWEIMCHPGYCDPDLLAVSSYNMQRENELDILTDLGLIKSIKDTGIGLINFDGIE